MSGLRFAFLTTFYPPYNFGGDGIGIQRLARGLARAGHRVTVVHDADAYHALHPGPPPPAEPEPAGVEVIGLRSSLGRVSALLTQQLGRPVVHGPRIARILADRRPDVINFHNVSLVGGPGLFRYGRGVKLYMAHEHWLVCPTHVLWRFGRERCPARACVRCQLSYARPPQWWRHTGLLERELHHIDSFIAMSEFSRAKHREFGFPREMDVLPYFLPAAATEDTPGASPHPRPYFLFVGRLEKIKGLDDVLPALRDYPDADLLIAGDGTYGDTLRRLAADNPRVVFLGRQGGEALRNLYANALGLLVPSVCFETFGIIVIEAFRQGTPVIVRRVGPLPELVETSGGGESFESPAELRAAMGRLQHDAGHRARLAANARQAFAQHWTEQAVIPQYLDIVRRAAERRPVPGVLARLEQERITT
jgi:glycosyltransferase involved in cell wall biosynthesis